MFYYPNTCVVIMQIIADVQSVLHPVSNSSIRPVKLDTAAENSSTVKRPHSSMIRDLRV